MGDDGRESLREYAWKYFALHADQRLRAFYFYVLLSTVIVGALLTVAKEAQRPGVGSPLAFGLVCDHPPGVFFLCLRTSMTVRQRTPRK